MTDEEVENLENQTVEVGEVVRVIANGRYLRAGGNSYATLTTTTQLTVTRITTGNLTVRTVDRVMANYEMRQISFTIRKNQLTRWDPNAPRPRRLGEKPDDDDLIDTDDPRIQWIFNDMGKYADEKGYCAEYDKLTARLGIPGRPRDFSVKFKIGDVSATTTVKARSQREANELVATATAAGTPSIIEQ